VLVFQEMLQTHSADDGYYLNTWRCAPQDLFVAALGLPMRVSLLGRNFKGPSIDQYESRFVVRADRRFHYLAWEG